ncbi:MAG: hypothetical protein FWD74_11520 [Actinomycetia bacterium]|nr:hypothetical protein [Actinomycetes bacterium]
MPTPQTPTAPAPRRLDRKLSAIKAGRYTPDDFIIADAKDADLAFGLTAAGPVTPSAEGSFGPGNYRTRAQFLDAMRAMIGQDSIDILLTSPANGEWLAERGALGEQVTLAVRANDTTDVWAVRGGGYLAAPSRPFRSTNLAAVGQFCDLVLYSMTFTNDIERDLATMEAYTRFRVEAADLGIRHFLEVFNPNAPAVPPAAPIGAFVNDWIMRALAGATGAHRPLFLKIAFNGPDALAELVEHDPSLVVGILGGSAGTTRDTYESLHQAEASGARIALFGRKIQRAESQLDLVALMRPVLRGDLTPADAVRAYHAALAGAGITPYRDLATDLQITDPALRAR